MSERRRWTILAVGTLAQAATSAAVYGVPMLIPALRNDGMSLLGASVIVSAPIAGLLLTLIAWGAAADRTGERRVITLGVGLASAFLVLAAVAPGSVGLGVFLFLAGAAAGSVNAASGRVVMGWFPVHERGLAMGTRQTAQPLGLAVAALALPPLAAAYGPHAALLFPALLCGLAALAVWLLVADPPRPVRAAGSAPAPSPYRGSWLLGRVHLASSLLVVPQFAVAAFALVFLDGERHWDPVAAGRLLFAVNLLGALGRVGSGIWSDRVGSRLRPIRQLAVASAVLMAAIAIGSALGAAWVVVAFGLASVVTVADNGLAYTAVAELAGAEWSGRALGVQNTVQNLASVATAPLLAALIGATSYSVGFAAVTVAPLLAVAVTPVGGGRRRPGVSMRDLVEPEVGGG